VHLAPSTCNIFSECASLIAYLSSLLPFYLTPVHEKAVRMLLQMYARRLHIPKIC